MTPGPTKAIDRATEQMIFDVMDGNPGACMIVCQILSSPLWYAILHALKARNLVGSELWRVVHDDYNDDWQPFVQALLQAPRN
jgi:hypothetical protein